jgi:phosphatidylglycerophosphatase C
MPNFMRTAVRPHRKFFGSIFLLPLILCYKAKLVSGTVIRAAICYVGFRRIPAHELEAHGRQFARTSCPRHCGPEAMARIAWHKSRSDTVVMVSGGLDLYLSHWCAAHGLELLCSVLEQRMGRFTGRYRGHQCVRHEKARLVQEHFPLSRFSRVFAYGDTPEDRELLAMAHGRYYRWQPASADHLAGR